MRPDPHVIDELANRVFVNALPPEWVHQKMSPDYGIDYQVTVYAAERPTPLRMAVQLKGTRSPLIRDGAVHFPLKVERLEEYLDLEPLPVFLVVADVTSERAWFVHLQAYALDLLAGQNWRAQETVTIVLPCVNDLRATESLRTALSEAWRRMAELVRSAPSAALRASRRRMESLDPRLVVRASADEHGEQYVVGARDEPVSLTLRLTEGTSGFAERLRALYRGEAVGFAPREVAFEGSPMFAELGSAATTLQIMSEGPTQVSIIARQGRRELARVSNLVGRRTIGLSGARLDATLGGGLLGLHARIDETGATARFHVQVNVRLEHWDSLPVLDLPFFDELESLVRAFGARPAVVLRLHLPGRDLDLPGCPFTDPESFAAVEGLLGLLAKARDVARRAGVNPPLPPTIDETAAATIENLHAALTRGSVSGSGAGRHVTVTATEATCDIGVVADLEVQPAGRFEELDLLGTRVCLQVHSILLTRARCEAVEAGPDNDRSARFRGTRGSKLRINATLAPTPVTPLSEGIVRLHRVERPRRRAGPPRSA